MRTFHLLSATILAGSALAAPALGIAAESHELINSRATPFYKRQGACGTWSTSTRLVDDGDPWQAPLHIQVSSNMNCGDGTCTIGHEASVSFTIGFSASGSVSGWISGGFAVEASIETGETRSCDGGEGETVCIWKAVGRTAYQVRDYMFNQCNTGEPAGDVHEMISPNSDGVGGGFYCVRGDACRNRGDQYEGPRFQGGPGTEDPDNTLLMLLNDS